MSVASFWLRSASLPTSEDDGKPLTVFTRARGLDRRVQRQHIGGSRDFLDDGDLLGDMLHRVDGLAHGLAAFLGVLRGFLRDLLGRLRVFGVMADI